jgi:hypothetical protein
MPKEPNITKEERKKARAEKRELRKKERARKRASGDNVVREKIWNGVKIFFKGVWKVIKGFFKYVLFPFWYTGVLMVKTVKFLRIRNEKPLTVEDKNFLSLIPTLFLSMSLSIAVVFLLFYFQVFDDIIDLFLNDQFWAAIGQIFVVIGEGIWWLLLVIFRDFFYELIIVPITAALTGHDWITAVVLLGGLIILSGLGILIYNFAKRSTLFERIKKALKKVFLLPKRFHNYLREEVVLKYFIGHRYIENRTKKFFWLNVLIQSILTLLFAIFSLYLGISKYFLYRGGNLETGWDGLDVMRYALFASLILFLLIGIFSTWFFSFVHGVSTMSDEEYEANKKRRKEKKQQRLEAKSKKQEEKQTTQEE